MAIRRHKPENPGRVHSWGYDPDARQLEIIFNPNNDRVYVYDDVPSSLVIAFLSAESMGQFIAQRIKGHYTYMSAESGLLPQQPEVKKADAQPCSFVAKDGRPCVLAKHEGGFHALKGKTP